MDAMQQGINGFHTRRCLLRAYTPHCLAATSAAPGTNIVDYSLWYLCNMQVGVTTSQNGVLEILLVRHTLCTLVVMQDDKTLEQEFRIRSWFLKTCRGLYSDATSMLGQCIRANRSHY
jgi:hypothetical protein